jgi:hypothetical protein
MLLFVLLVAWAFPFEWMFSGSFSVEGKDGFRPSMSVSKGVDVDNNRMNLLAFADGIPRLEANYDCDN